MKLKRLTHNGSTRMLLFFVGWGMDYRQWVHLQRDDYDLAVAYDYRTAQLPDERIFDEYQEICVIAWSFGVVNAARFIATHPHLPLTLRVAVNGTHHPVHETMGIPASIFQGTLQALSEDSLMKFYRRMCGSRQACELFLIHKPQRPIEELADELRAIAAIQYTAPELIHWDAVYVSGRDMVIPAANQLNAWRHHHNLHILEQAAHLPDFKAIIDSTLTRKPLVANRFSRAIANYDANATAQQAIATSLAEIWRKQMPPQGTFGQLLEIGAGTGLFTRAYMPFVDIKCHRLWDIAHIAPELPGTHEICDAETAIRHIPDKSLDAIVSASTIQWFNSPSEFLQQCARTLRHGGITVLSTFGNRNFHELHAAGIPIPAYLTAEALHSIIPRELLAVHISEQTIVEEFANAHSLMRHMHLTGVNATAQTGIATTRRLLSAPLTRLTYHPIYLLLRKL